jgi:hypothetical protein
MSNSIKILSMDGGNGLNTAELLTQLENTEGRRFLDQTDIFTGTSAGGINSLFFAASNNPTDALADIKTFWNKINISILEGLESPAAQQSLRQNQAFMAAVPPSADIGTFIRTAAGLSMALWGLRSLFVNDAMKAFLLQRFGDMRLGDLHRYPVVVLSFQLDKQPASQSTDMRSWAPKLYTNLDYTVQVSNGSVTQQPNPDMEERVVDVAMRTSAAPLELPIYQSLHGTEGLSGFVDGGLVANNPSMITLAAIVGSLANGTTSQPPQPAGDSLNEIKMLSVGTGRNLVGTAQYLEAEFTDGSAAWGYQKWLLEPSNPLVLVDAFLQGGNESAAFQCRILLGDDNFNRLNVPIKDFLVPDDPRTRAAVASSAAWLRKSGWYVPRSSTQLTASAQLAAHKLTASTFREVDSGRGARLPSTK